MARQQRRQQECELTGGDTGKRGKMRYDGSRAKLTGRDIGKWQGSREGSGSVD